MPHTQLIIRKVLEGRIARNDGEFAEIETIGTEGIENPLVKHHPDPPRGHSQRN
jgi:hypothetical protein